MREVAVLQAAVVMRASIRRASLATTCAALPVPSRSISRVTAVPPARTSGGVKRPRLLLRWTGRRSWLRAVACHPAGTGLFGKPTIVNNAETLT